MPLPRALSALASTRRIALALVAAALLLCGQQAHALSAGCTAVPTSLTLLAGTSGYGTITNQPFNAGEVITISSTSAGAILLQQANSTPLIGNPTGLAANTPGSYTIPTSTTYSLSTSGYGAAYGAITIVATCSAPPVFTVTVNTDTTAGTASNCTAGSTTDASCSLRDALAAVTANSSVSSIHPGIIQFSTTVFRSTNTAAQNTITISATNGNSFVLPPNTTINGLTTGSGATLTNLITVTGGSNSGLVFSTSSAISSPGITVNNLNITGATYSAFAINSGVVTMNQCSIYGNNASGNGAAITLSTYSTTATLTLNNSTISGNTTSSTIGGGGIFVNASTSATINNSTIAGNSAPNGSGGGIYVYSGGTLNLNSVTIAANTTKGLGGGLVNSGTVNASAVLIANNTATGTGTYADTVGNTISNPGNSLIGTSSSQTSTYAASVKLAPLGFYGGPTQTMAELPTSFSIAYAVAIAGTDQRGAPRSSPYNGSTNYTDAGAVQATFIPAFTTQPAAGYYSGLLFGSSAPVLSVQDDGVTLPVSTGNFNIVDSKTAIGGTTSYTPISGSSTLSATDITSAQTSDTLVATYTYTPSSVGSAQTTAVVASNSFVVATPLAGFSISTLTGGAAGTPQGVTLTALSSTGPNVTATNFVGNVTVTSTDPAAVINGTTIGTGFTVPFTGANSGTITLPATALNGLVFKTAGTAQTITLTGANATATSNPVAITAGAASTITAATGSGQSAKIGAAFTNPLQVQVLDAYSNPVGGALVIFSSPSTGASAITNPSLCTTSTSANATTANPVGTCSSVVTANGTANATSYTVTATTGALTPASFTLTNTVATPTLTLSASPSVSSTYGQPVSVTATSSPATAGSSSPTGVVTFKDGSATLTPSITPTTGVSTYTYIPTGGAHSFTAVSTADTNFAAATATAYGYTVNKASVTLGLPTINTLVTPGSTTTLPLTVTGQYSGTGVFGPTGTISYYYTASGSSAQIGAGTLTAVSGTSSYNVPVPSTVASVSGNYTLSVTYAGDTNYAAITTAATATITVGTPSFTVTAAPTALTITRGNTGTAVITFTPTGGYTGTASLSCTGLPVFVSCAFNPATVVMTGNNAILTTTLTIYTLAPNAVASSTFWIPGIALVILLFVRRRKLSTPLRSCIMLAVLACIALSATGCGKSSFNTPTGTTTAQVNVSAVATVGSTSANSNQTANISITIQ